MTISAARDRAAVNQARHQTLSVQIEASSPADRDALLSVFWRFMGDLVAEVLLADVERSGGATQAPEREILAL